MEQYLALSRENQALGVVKPEIGGNVNFEIKSQFMRELREETFSGNKNEDAHDHVDRVLNIVSLFNILGVSQDAVLLRVFPFTLTGTAKRWVDRLTPRAVNTWDLLKKAFIQRMTPTQALMAIQTMADHSQKWHDETLSRSLSSNSNTDGLAAIDHTSTKNALSMGKSNRWGRPNMGNLAAQLRSTKVMEQNTV
ncbi:uncharacterized mitochondrial protein-like protein [Tanacetum coccineum]|uniref:Uncharacterized mitochondrial protein-like protein n=1 Tax=Tanacetum coccineum TaxID=301880 RepID=A0ABQ5GL80_9ASTR